MLKLMGATYQSEMLPSVLAKELAPCLGTVQAQPITIGATSPSEGLVFEGQALPIIPPLSLKSTLASPAGPLTDLQALRDQTLSQLNDLYKSGASQTQRAYLDSLVTSQKQVRNINQDLLERAQLDQGQHDRFADHRGVDAGADEGDAGGRHPHPVRWRQPPRRGAGDRDGADGGRAWRRSAASCHSSRRSGWRTR